MDQGTGDSTAGLSTPVTDDIVVKLELPWPIKEEPQDQPSAVYSTGQPMSDNTSGSLLSLNTSHACQRCSVRFKLSSSLEIHMETFHGETPHSGVPVDARLHGSMPSGQERCSTEMTEDSRDPVTSSNDFVIKVEPSWSLKEEPQDHPSAVCSPGQPMSDNTSGSLLSLNTSHACQRCSAAFVLSSSLELHMVMFHGETLQDVFSVCSAYKSYGVGDHHSSNIENVGNCNNDDGVKRKEENKEDHAGKKVRKHVCDLCNYTFTRQGSLRRHKDSYCPKLFRKKAEDEDPAEIERREKCRKHVCDVCKKAFLRLGHLNSHKLSHTGHKPFVCDVCGKGFTRSSILKTHKLNHTGHKPFACEMCDKSFTNVDSLKAHKLTHRSFVCEVCGEVLTQAKGLRKHKLIHTTHKPCVKAKSNDTDATDRGQKVRQHECGVCQKTFLRVGHLNSHKLSHTGHKPFVCDVCSKAFTRSTTLKNHKLIHTGHKLFACDMCNMTFPEADQLMTHKFTHTVHKPFVCDVCGKAFTRSTNLKNHKLIHTGHTGCKRLVCEVCNKAFSKASNLKFHKKIHTGERPYKGTQCDAEFKVLTHLLSRTMLAHIGDPPDGCDVCNKAFSSTAHLKRMDEV